MTPPRPVSRFVRVWAIATAVVGFALLFALGGFVTSFKVGMADPVWPTEPWYLVDKDWKRLEFGFLVEHTHRAAGWVFGVMVIVLIMNAWWEEPNRTIRFSGYGAILGLVSAYGTFHRSMMAAGKELANGIAIRQIDWSRAQSDGIMAAALAALVLGFATLTLIRGGVGHWPRTLALVLLVAVMVQGLLGGFRVLLNELFGPLLAAYHGIFAQFVFCLVVAVAVLAAPPDPNRVLPDPVRRRLTRLGWKLVALTFLQLVYGAMVRHTGTPLAQRLHILTAFAVAGSVTWVAVAVFTTRTAEGFRWSASVLLGLLSLQVALGVESYLVKFAVVGPEAVKPPDQRAITEWSAGLRTGHLLVGLGLLATAVAFALRANRAVSAPDPAANHTITPAARPEPAAVG